MPLREILAFALGAGKIARDAQGLDARLSAHGNEPLREDTSMFRKHRGQPFAATLAVWFIGTWCELGIPAATAQDSRGVYSISLPAAGSLDMATHVDLKRSLELAGANLVANLDPERHYLPNWDVRPAKDGAVAVNTWWPGHNLGRWWDAMSRLQEAIGYAAPVQAKDAMEQNLLRFYDNPDSLCLAPFDLEGVKPQFDLHSLREGLLGLNALIQHRQNSQAAVRGHAMSESLMRLTTEESTWVLENCDYARRTGLDIAKTDWGLVVGYPANHGRLIEALVWNYEATGDSAALRAAERFARFHFANTVRPDGSLGKQPGNHTHSYLGTLRGLLLFGELTGQREYIDAVADTYRVTVRTRLKKSGFISHDMDKDSMGEPTSPGDAAQLALWLATRHSYTEYFDDVERIVRARLIPCQITAAPSLKQEKFAPLLIGAYGGMYTAPHAGKIATTDITAAVTHTLVDVYRHIAERDDNTLKINLHFDFEDADVCIVSKRATSAAVSIIPKRATNILIRIPRWTPRQSVSLKAAGQPIDLLMLGDYALVPKEQGTGTIELTYSLPVTTETERTDNVDYAITWRGDEIIGISPNSDFYPFYPDAPNTEKR
jgi:hypothetical protein